jgi:asparagine synthase (glutamine-hydrolysing)
MCGIFGILNFEQQPLDINLVEKATSILRHRGPDDEGYLLYQGVSQKALACGGKDTDQRIELPSVFSQTSQSYDLAFGHRRLAILDLSPGGHQPMASPDGHYWIVYNGEIYNYIELRNELIQQGFSFHTSSDTEVLLAAFSHWGPAMLSRLVGMFAFCILDTRAQRLFLARDFFGIKPLYYTWTNSCFAFASEIKALLTLPNTLRQGCPQTLYAYMRYAISDYGDMTFFKGINQIPASNYLEIDLVHPLSPQPQPYWNVNTDINRHISLDEAAGEIRRLFLENIRYHLRSDVPVGSCLSGGIDSSSIVAAMRHQQSNLQLHTFSYIAKDPRINEEVWVDLVANRTNAISHKVTFGPHDMVADLDRLIEVQEEPFGSTSIYAQYRVFQLAHENGIKVMEDGQGADEMFGGYFSLLSTRLASLISSCKLYKAVHFYQSAKALGTKQSLLSRRTWGFFLPKPIRHQVRKFIGKGVFIPWINENWFADRGVSEVDWFQRSSSDFLHRALLQSFNQTSLPTLLHYEDRNSMAFSIESRVPFLTPTMAQFVFSLPEEFIIDDNALTKSVFRKAMRGLVPDAVLDRRDKIGFETPEKHMLSTLNPWVEQTFSGQPVRQVKALNLDEAKNEWKAVLNENKPFDFRIWRMLNLIKWADKFGVEF